MVKSKGDNRDICDTNFAKQDRYRKKANRTNTYDICDKRCSRRVQNTKKKFKIYRLREYDIKNEKIEFV